MLNMFQVSNPNEFSTTFKTYLHSTNPSKINQINLDKCEIYLEINAATCLQNHYTSLKRTGKKKLCLCGCFSLLSEPGGPPKTEKRSHIRNLSKQYHNE